MAASPVAAVAALALAASGCGSASGAAGGGGDPASLVPASSPFYAVAVVRPDGALKASLDADSQKLLRVADPGARIQALLAPALRRQGLDYKRDIQPWLGSRAGVYLNSLGGSSPDGAAVIATTDPSKARGALARAARSGHGAAPSARSYRGVAYEVAGTTADGIVGKFAVVGSEAGLRAVIDVKDGANSLAADPTFRTAIAGIAKNTSLGLLYAQPRGLLGAAVQAAGGQPKTAKQARTISVLQALARAIGTNGVVAALTTTPRTIGLQVSSSGSKPAGARSAAADTLAALPADSWLALGAGDIGRSISRGLATLRSLARSGAGLKLPRRLGVARGFDLQRDLLSWAGDAGVFVRGTGLTDISVAIVIASKNRAASRAAVPRIAALIKGAAGKGATSRRIALPGTDGGVAITPGSVPIAIDVVDAGAKVVIGLGDASVSQALHPSGRFADSAAFRTAAATLGSGVRPVFVLDFAGALRLLSNLGQTSNASLARALPYLRSLTTLAVGTGHNGTETLARVALGLR